MLNGKLQVLCSLLVVLSVAVMSTVGEILFRMLNGKLQVLCSPLVVLSVAVMSTVGEILFRTDIFTKMPIKCHPHLTLISVLFLGLHVLEISYIINRNAIILNSSVGLSS